MSKICVLDGQQPFSDESTGGGGRGRNPTFVGNVATGEAALRSQQQHRRIFELPTTNAGQQQDVSPTSDSVTNLMMESGEDIRSKYEQNYDDMIRCKDSMMDDDDQQQHQQSIFVDDEEYDENEDVIEGDDEQVLPHDHRIDLRKLTDKLITIFRLCRKCRIFFFFPSQHAMH